MNAGTRIIEAWKKAAAAAPGGWIRVGDIAAAAGVSESTARKYLRAAGLIEPGRKRKRTSAAVIREYKKGLSVGEIAAAVGTVKQNVRDHLRAAGLPLPGQRKSATAVAVFREGGTVREAAEAAGISEPTARKYLRAAGLVPPVHGRKNGN